MIAIIDWLTVSFKSVTSFDCVLSYFGLNKADFKPVAGHWSYMSGLWRPGISIYYTEHRSDVYRTTYDVCVNMSGTGCRLYETIRGRGHDWIAFLSNIQRDFPGYNFSRVDVALDIKDDSCPSMVRIIQLVETKHYRSLFRRVVTGHINEEWVYMGSPSSSTRLRIYNKALERNMPNEKWVRFEYQLRDESADRFLNHLFKCRHLGQAMKDFLEKSISFFQPGMMEIMPIATEFQF